MTDLLICFFTANRANNACCILLYSIQNFPIASKNLDLPIARRRDAVMSHHCHRPPGRVHHCSGRPTTWTTNSIAEDRPAPTGLRDVENSKTDIFHIYIYIYLYLDAMPLRFIFIVNRIFRPVKGLLPSRYPEYKSIMNLSTIVIRVFFFIFNFNSFVTNWYIYVIFLFFSMPVATFTSVR